MLRCFEVITTPNQFEIFPIGFSNNVYGEQAYAFNFNVDFDVSNYYDQLKFPATELYLFAQYKPTISQNETMSFTDFATDGRYTKILYLPTQLNIGDFVETLNFSKLYNFIEYTKSEFLQTQLSGQTVYITTPYNNGVDELVWKYNPFIPLRLRYFSDDIYMANTGSTSHEQVASIPSYATSIGDGNYVWRDILPQGYFDSLSGIGVDYPFVNKKRYLFTNIIFDVTPDLTNANTLAAFNEVWFSRDAITINYTPIGDINNIGMPCQ
jgi:hypothetical protein